MKSLALFLVFTVVLFLASFVSCVTPGTVTVQDQQLVCPDSPIDDYVLFMPLDGGVVLNKSDGSSIRAMKVPKGVFNPDNNPQRWVDFVEAVKKLQEQQKVSP